MLLKLFNTFEKILFIFALLSLATNFNFIVVGFVNKPDISNTIRFVTKIPFKSIGPTIRIISDFFNTFFFDAAFYLVLFMFIFHPVLRVKIAKTFWKTGLLVLLIFALASSFWSVMYVDTIFGVYFVIKITLIGLYLSQRYSIQENLNLLIVVLSLIILFSIFAIWQLPGKSLHPGGEWRGIFISKNFLGRIMAFGALMLIVYWLKTPSISKRIFTLVLLILSGILLFFSKSTTSFVIVLFAGLPLIFYWIYMKWLVRFNIHIRWGMIVAGIFTILLALWQADAIFAFLNKASTLTGRTVLWQILWEWFQKSPLFGFGYEAFWSQFPAGIQPVGSEWVDAVARHAHNGYIDVALALGFVGLLLFLFVLLLAWKNSLILFRQAKDFSYLWPLLALFYLTIANLTYSIAFAQPDFHWLLFVLVSGLVVSNPSLLKVSITETKNGSPTVSH